MANRFETHALAPFRIIGTLHIALREDKTGRGPSLSFYLDPLPVTEPPQVAISLDPIPNLEELFSSMGAKNMEMRPASADWIGATFTSRVLRVFDERPATDFAFSWLHSDLRSLGWTDRLL